MQVALEESNRLEHIEHRALPHPLRQRCELAGLRVTDVHQSSFAFCQKEAEAQTDVWTGEEGGLRQSKSRKNEETTAWSSSAYGTKLQLSVARMIRCCESLGPAGAVLAGDM